MNHFQRYIRRGVSLFYCFLSVSILDSFCQQFTQKRQRNFFPANKLPNRVLLFQKNNGIIYYNCIVQAFCFRKGCYEKYWEPLSISY